MRLICVNSTFFRIQRIGINAESMILRGDRDLSCSKILDRLIGSPVAELEFKGPPPEGQSQELMAQTDPEDGSLPDEFRGLFQWRRDSASGPLARLREGPRPADRKGPIPPRQWPEERPPRSSIP